MGRVSNILRNRLKSSFDINYVVEIHVSMKCFKCSSYDRELILQSLVQKPPNGLHVYILQRKYFKANVLIDDRLQIHCLLNNEILRQTSAVFEI